MSTDQEWPEHRLKTEWYIERNIHIKTEQARACLARIDTLEAEIAAYRKLAGLDPIAEQLRRERDDALEALRNTRGTLQEVVKLVIKWAHGQPAELDPDGFLERRLLDGRE